MNGAFRRSTPHCPRFVRELLLTTNNSAQTTGRHHRENIGMNWGELGTLPVGIALITQRFERCWSPNVRLTLSSR
jgi:hypothetical protein